MFTKRRVNMLVNDFRFEMSAIMKMMTVWTQKFYINFLKFKQIIR